MSAISRRKFLAAAAALPYSLKSFAAAAPSGLAHVYFGTDTDTDDKTSKGVYEALWNPATGKFGTPRLVAKEWRPTYLAQVKHCIYVLDEVNDADSTLEAYRRNSDGSLHKLNSVTTKGFGAAYVSIHPSGRAAYVANYAGGSITSFGILPDGRLTPPVAHFQYTGHGPNAVRQAAPHAHSVVVSPDGNFLLVNDLGLDEIHVYRIDPVNPSDITPNAPEAWVGLPGAGSRHLAFSLDARTVYNINELASSIDVLQWDAKQGILTTTAAGPVSTLPSGFQGTSAAAEILVSPDGRFVYASNRGDDSVTVFSISPKDMGLSLVQRISTAGKTPRHITISPDGKWLIAANQNSDSIVVFQRSEADGTLTATGNTITVPHPMFILFT